MPPAPATVTQYLASLPEDRRRALEAIRKVIRKNLPKGYQEGIQYGMMGYFVPHSVCPLGYHCDPKQPVPFVSVASQKNHIGLYLFCAYMDAELQQWFTKAWKATGKKLDMGKSCVRVKKLEDVPLEVLGELVSRCPCDEFLAMYESKLPEKVKVKRAGGAPKTTTKKPTAKKTAKKAAKKVTTKKTVAKSATKKTATKKKAAKKVAKKNAARSVKKRV